MTLDQVIAEAESDLTQASVLGVKAAIAAWIPGSVAFFLTPVGNFLWNLIVSPIVTAIAKVIIKQADNAGYYLYKSAVNNSAAGTYEDAIRASQAAAASGDQNAISKARAAQRAAFVSFWNLSGPRA